MEHRLSGIHHVTAIARDPQRNIDFYAGFLGLRLVKVTVNFDDPGTYHLYYGDGMGRPGTLLTFFPWPGARPGANGTAQASAVSFTIPGDALRFWMDRCAARGVAYEGPIHRLGETYITFFDPDELQVELVAIPELGPAGGWPDGPVPGDMTLRSLFGVTLIADQLDPTGPFLTGVLGFNYVAEGPNHRFRFCVGPDAAGSYVDVLALPGMARGQMGAGAIHHIAWRTENDTAQERWRSALVDNRVYVTPFMDRRYFRSIYFREPGGVLFEIATDPPGFTVDEPAAALGSELRLPPHLEGRREELLRTLPPLRLPAQASRP